MNEVKSQKWMTAMQQAQQYLQQGHLENAIGHYALATKLDPVRAESWVNLGIIQYQTNQHTEALDSLKKAIKLNPNVMEAYTALGDIYRLHGKEQESLNAYQRAAAVKRTPLSLNKLACSLRTAGEFVKAEALYKEALSMAPEFTLAKTNLATLQIELQRFDAARDQLKAVRELPCSKPELEEIDCAQMTLDEYFRLQPLLLNVIKKCDLGPLHNALNDTPAPLLQADKEILAGIQQYAESANHIPNIAKSEDTSLPKDWPLIEALFMIPFIKNTTEYRELKDNLNSEITPSGNLLESLNMELVVRASYACVDQMNDPIMSEMNIRHWHLLATQGVTNMTPGHFKMTRNQSRADPTKRRAEPHLSVGTFRQFMRNIYPNLPAGMPRGLVILMAISDIHPFSDGNGRIALTWLNRELEAAGQFPALFTRENGIKGKLGAAMRKVRTNKGDLSYLVPVILEAQNFARTFCRNLTQ